MFSRPLPGMDWIQALADSGPWRPPPEWAQDYSWLDQLPRAIGSAAGREIQPEADMPRRMADPAAWQAKQREWTDIPAWLQALGEDQNYLRARVIESPYGGWGGGAMQARRRGLR